MYFSFFPGRIYEELPLFPLKLFIDFTRKASGLGYSL
jgi:hypothetical protein